MTLKFKINAFKLTGSKNIFFIESSNLLLIFLRVNFYCVLFILLEQDTLEENFYDLLHYRCLLPPPE